MDWNFVNDAEQLEGLEQESQNKDVVIFKHSTRCGTSAMSLDRIERSWKDSEMSNVSPYLLDVIGSRSASNAVAERYGVRHESPQVLLLRNGEVVYHDSHFGINYNDLKELASKES